MMDTKTDSQPDQLRAPIRHAPLQSSASKDSPAFVSAPEGNGSGDRFISTLKENLIRVRYVETIEELRRALLAFRKT